MKVLIANRGEIACRVIRSCRALGIRTVAVYSEADRDALHTVLADEAHLIGPARAQESYLNVSNILEALRRSGADAVHPGYGFMSENASFAEAVIDAKRAWVGPAPETITAMGDKEKARQLAKAAGVPILPGSRRYVDGNFDELAATADSVGYPLLVKAAGGGGGIGMQRVDDPSALLKAAQSTQALAQRAFGDPTIYLERYIPRARHIEVQVFGFGDGRVVHMFERECSVQRRFQKVIEESPAPGIETSLLKRMTAAATALASSQNYSGAGTVEFVVDAMNMEFHFLEMNTRIQVEHPVTEMVTGLDLVELQLRQAVGDDLSSVTQESIRRTGHALECRLYAEDPNKNFMPSPGRLSAFELPVPNSTFRVETGVRSGDAISVYYDPLIAKVICAGRDRASTIEKSVEQLQAIKIAGIRTNVRFLAKVLRHASFAAGEVHTRFIDEHRSALIDGA